MNLRKLKNQAGFTLVELIVVIAIMAILAGVAVPVYSGYIEKANKAADLQLLGAVNSAFGAACAENDIFEIADGDAQITISSQKIDLASPRANNTDVSEAFARYFAGNENAEFKVIVGLKYEDGAFKDVMDAKLSDTMQSVMDAIKANPDIDVETLLESQFGELGAAKLLSQVDFATALANELSKNDPDSKLSDMISFENNIDSIAKYLGFENAAADGAAEAIGNLVQAKAELLAAAQGKKLNELSDEEYSNIMADASIEVGTNSAVLVAATNSNFDTESFKNSLASGTAKSVILSSLGTTENMQTGLAQSALAYGMYTAYASRNGLDTNADMTTVLSALETKEFKDYMASDEAQTDMDGYLTAMDMINTSSQNKDAVSNVLVNGFDDPDLLTMLQQVMGK